MGDAKIYNREIFIEQYRRILLCRSRKLENILNLSGNNNIWEIQGIKLRGEIFFNGRR